jgi:hypothetical protein
LEQNGPRLNYTIGVRFGITLLGVNKYTDLVIWILVYKTHVIKGIRNVFLASFHVMRILATFVQHAEGSLVASLSNITPPIIEGVSALETYLP